MYKAIPSCRRGRALLPAVALCAVASVVAVGAAIHRSLAHAQRRSNTHAASTSGEDLQRRIEQRRGRPTFAQLAAPRRTGGAAEPAPIVAVRQPVADCGPRALSLACATLGVRADAPALAQLAHTDARGATMAGLAQAADAVGLKAEGVQMDRSALRQLSSPAVAWVEGNHYIAVLRVDGDEAHIHDPNLNHEEVIDTQALLIRSGGVLLTLARR